MADSVPQMEIKDSSGETTFYSGSVGTTAALVPPVAANTINEFMVRCPSQTPVTKKLLYSIDGVTYLELTPGEAVLWPLKGSKKQVYLKGSTAGVNYELILNTDQAGD